GAIVAQSGFQNLPIVRHIRGTSDFLLTWQAGTGIGNLHVGRFSNSGSQIGTTQLFKNERGPELVHDYVNDQFAVVSHRYFNSGPARYECYGRLLDTQGQQKTLSVFLGASLNIGFPPPVRVVYNAVREEYITVWGGGASGAYGIHGQRLTTAGALS